MKLKVHHESRRNVPALLACFAIGVLIALMISGVFGPIVG